MRNDISCLRVCNWNLFFGQVDHVVSRFGRRISSLNPNRCIPLDSQSGFVYMVLFESVSFLMCFTAQREMTALAYAREKGLTDIGNMLSDALYVANTSRKNVLRICVSMRGVYTYNDVCIFCTNLIENQEC